MSSVIRERVTVDEREEFVVLLIGMRINRWWKLHRWLPVALSMRRMVKQLGQLPRDSGYLGGEYRTVGNPIIFVQYWRSYDRLEAYASNKDLAHLPMWGWFFKAIALGGDVGIYHEAYRIAPGNYESVYLNMPPFGLGRVFPRVPAARGLKSSRGRMDKLRESEKATCARPEPAEEPA